VLVGKEHHEVGRTKSVMTSPSKNANEMFTKLASVNVGDKF